MIRTNRLLLMAATGFFTFSLCATGSVYANEAEDLPEQIKAQDLIEQAEAGTSISSSVSVDADGSVTVKINDESRIFQLDGGDVPAEVQEWAKGHGVELVVKENSVSVKSVAGDAEVGGGEGVPGVDLDKFKEDFERLKAEFEQRLANNVELGEAGESVSCSVSVDADGKVTVKINDESRTFQLDGGDVPAEIKEWAKANGVELVVTDDSVSVKTSAGHAEAGGGEGAPGVDLDKFKADFERLKEEVMQRLADGHGAELGEAGKSVSSSVSVDADGVVTVKINDETRIFQLDEGGVPAEIQEWAQSHGAELVVTENSVSVKAVAGDAEGVPGVDLDKLLDKVQEELDRQNEDEQVQPEAADPINQV